MREHWLARVAPGAVWALRLVSWLVAGATAVIPMIKGSALEWVFFFSLSGIALASGASFYLIRLGDYIEGLREDASLGALLADALDERASVGETTMRGEDAARIWKDLDPQPASRRSLNTKFRWIKQAVNAGYVSGEPLIQVEGRDTAYLDTVINVHELAVFLRRKDWRKLVSRSHERGT